MKIILAGFNLDKTTINEFRNFIREVAKKLDKNYFLKLNPLEKQHLLDQLSQKAYELIQRRENRTKISYSGSVIVRLPNMLHLILM